MPNSYLANRNEELVRIPYQDRFTHTMILGPSGCGKSSQMMLPMIHQDIHNNRAALIVFDGKGDICEPVMEMAAETKRSAIYLDLRADSLGLKADKFPRFNPLVGDEEDVICSMQTAMNEMFESAPEYFKVLIRQTLQMALRVLIRLDKEHWWTGKYATFENLQHVLCGDEEGMKLLSLYEHGNDADNEYIVAWFKDVYFVDGSKVYEDSSGLRAAISKLNDKLGVFLNFDPEENLRNELDFDKCFMDESIICFTVGDLLHMHQVFMKSIMMSRLEQAIKNRNEGSRGAFVYIDEFQVYATKSFCKSGLMLRNKNVALQIALQSRVQLPPECRQNIDIHVENIILMSPMPSDAVFYANYFDAFYESGTQGLGDRVKDSAGYMQQTMLRMQMGDALYFTIYGNVRQVPCIGRVGMLTKDDSQQWVCRLPNEEIVIEKQNLQ